MKTPKNVVPSAPGDRRGLAAVKKLVEKLKEEYAAGLPKAHALLDHVSIMAGPVKKIR